MRWREKREIKIYSREKREGDELNVKKACDVGIPHQQETPMWMVWTCSALFDKFRNLEMHF
jgi:hypothetical protein